MKILITGGDGYVAKILWRSLLSKYNVKSVSRKDFDLSDPKESRDWFGANRSFDVVIHTAIKGGSRLCLDSSSVIDSNLKMYYNLLDNSKYFKRLISFGSGAELHQPNTPYGLSKKVIAESIMGKNDFFNLRIFGLFNEDELETRFIKSNILRYINKEAMEIHGDKFMDFLYTPDLALIVDYYINNANAPKTFNCIYNSKPIKLSDIAELINNLDSHRVEIKIGTSSPSQVDYVGCRGETLDKIKLLGLEYGLRYTYNTIKRLSQANQQI